MALRVRRVGPVFERTMLCCRAAVLGGLLKSSWVGLRARPGSGRPLPVRVEVTAPAEVATVRVPVRGPVVVGAKMIWVKQDAAGERVAQVCPPLVLGTTVKSPVVVMEVMVAVAA